MKNKSRSQKTIYLAPVYGLSQDLTNAITILEGDAGYSYVDADAIPFALVSIARSLELMVAGELSNKQAKKFKRLAAARLSKRAASDPPREEQWETNANGTSARSRAGNRRGRISQSRLSS
jgi:hypothetical protein